LHECPLCGAEPGPYETVDMHIFTKHVHRNKDMRSYMCWCGFIGYSAQSLFCHWKDYGGILAHYLAFHLDVDADF
jgi:hypothetical protein